MNNNNIKRKNHYVSQAYLKRWESSFKKIWTYNTLVSEDKVPLWKERSISGIAYRPHLYTEIVDGNESDEIENWFEKEYETPAEKVIEKVIFNRRMSPDDWDILVRFLAAQDVRTPVRYLQHQKLMEEKLPDSIEETLEELKQLIESNSSLDIISGKDYSEINTKFPMKVITTFEEGKEFSTIEAKVLIGRKSWLSSFPRLLKDTANVLHNHKWTIMLPAKGLTWITSDNPVIRLNAYGLGEYDLLGGWGNKGGDLFLPLSPHHILYTQIGNKHPPRRGTRFSLEHTKMIRRFSAENAFRMIFSNTPDMEIEKIRSRIVDNNQYRKEEMDREEWHQYQSLAEKEY